VAGTTILHRVVVHQAAAVAQKKSPQTTQCITHLSNTPRRKGSHEDRHSFLNHTTNANDLPNTGRGSISSPAKNTNSVADLMAKINSVKWDNPSKALVAWSSSTNYCRYYWFKGRFGNSSSEIAEVVALVFCFFRPFFVTSRSYNQPLRCVTFRRLNMFWFSSAILSSVLYQGRQVQYVQRFWKFPPFPPLLLTPLLRLLLLRHYRDYGLHVFFERGIYVRITG